MKMLFTVAVLLLLTCATPLFAQHDITVSLTADKSTVIVGDRIGYTITVRNNGPDTIVQDSNMFLVYDNFSDPSNVELASIEGSVSAGILDLSGGIAHWYPPSLASGQQQAMTLSWRVTGAGTIQNWVTAEFPGWMGDSDPNPGNNRKTNTVSSVLPQPTADLSVSKWDTQDPVPSGVSFNYNVLVVNHGPSVASNVVVRDTLPAGVEFNVTSNHISQGSIQSTNGGVIVWTVGVIPVNGDASMAVDAVSVAGVITNTVAVTNNIIDPVDSNDCAREVTTVQPVADLMMMSRDFPGVADAGSPFTYYLLVSNAGPEAAEAVIVTNWVPSWARFLGATNLYGAWTQTLDAVVFSLGDMPAGDGRMVGIAYAGLRDGQHTNTASVASSSMDWVPENNIVVDITQVFGSPVAEFVPRSAFTNSVRSLRVFGVRVTTNGYPVTGVPVFTRVARGPHAGFSMVAMTGFDGIADFDSGAYRGWKPGLDRLSATGMVGMLSFAADAQVYWRLRTVYYIWPWWYGAGGMGIQETTDPELNIPVGSGTNILLNVDENLLVRDVNVKLHLQHERLAAVGGMLRSPQGTEAILFGYLGQATNGVGFGADFTLDDDAPTPVVAGAEPFAGSYRTATYSLHSLTNQDAEGTWVLALTNLYWDSGDRSTGVLKRVRLELTPDDGDRDDDGMDDEWEGNNSLNPSDPSDGMGDADHDGTFNRSEFLLGSDPQDEEESFLITTGMVSGASGEAVLVWRSFSNNYYTVEVSTNLTKTFAPVATNIAASPSFNQFTNPAGSASGFFRVLLEE